MGRCFSILTSLFVLLFILASSCKKDGAAPSYPAGSNENINTWVLDSLKRYYYWNDALPANPDISLDPKAFFSSVRHTRDRFSFILIPGDPSTRTPAARDYGFECITAEERNTQRVIGIVTLVLQDSPASRAGLKRGDYILKINGTVLSNANAATLLNEALIAGRFSLQLGHIQEDNTWQDDRLIEIGRGVIPDQRPLNRIIEYRNKKVGYLSIHDFPPGTAASITAALPGFRAAGISDLILDLRYNSGGQVTEAAGLCALVAQGVSYDKAFITYRGNRNGGVRTESIGSAATFDGTLNFNTILQHNLGLGRVYILSSGSTASAAEVVINNLKPFMQVILIGGKTRGKDEASFRIFDARTPKLVEWEMHPIIYKLFNADGKGGYEEGITPDFQISELSALPLKPLGDVNDPLISSALSQMMGGVRSSSTRAVPATRDNLLITNVISNSQTARAESSIVLTHR